MLPNGSGSYRYNQGSVVTIPRIIALIAVLTFAVLGYRFWGSSNVSPVAVSVPVLTQQDATQPTDISGGAPVQEVNAPALIDQPGCLTLKQFEELPELIQDAARMEAVSANGNALNAYQFLGEDTLRGFADQGDSAAMVIIGANAVVRAFEMDPSLAVDWLNHKQQINDLNFGKEELSATASLELNDAAYWFYEAAMRGRLLALQNYGQVRGRLFGGPVGLGWITREEYDALSASEKTSIDPANVYNQVAYDIAPALRKGALGGLSRMIPQSALQQAIRQDLVTEFEQTLSDSGLPAIEVAPAASSEIEALFDQICESEKQEELRRRGLE